MKRLRAWLFRLCGLFNKERRDRELAEEIESHIQRIRFGGLAFRR